MDEVPPTRTARIGVVATDPLRVFGLKAIFSDATPIEIVPLSIPGALDDANLSLVLIDAECTTHLFELISTFRHVRPHVNLIVLGNETSQEFIGRVIGAGAKGSRPHRQGIRDPHGHRNGARRFGLGAKKSSVATAR
jgi:DNA-binding NarL/FixJ family response regulator